MLWRILQAHNGKLPPDVYVCFANTGRELEETLKFVHACEIAWNVPVNWLEYDQKKAPPKVVTFKTASRNGEPFAQLISERPHLPNAIARYCTVELKIMRMRDFMRGNGHKHYTSVLGLRADEMWRVFKAAERSLAKKDPWTNKMPLADAGIRKTDVLDFWARQSFDLGLRHYEGNCDMCFLKSNRALERMMREQPDRSDWWIEQEAQMATIAKTRRAGQFRERETYADTLQKVENQPLLINDSHLEDEEFGSECGMICGAEDAA